MPMQLRRQLHPPGRALGQWAGIASVSPGCKPMHVLQIRNNHERKTHKPEAHQCNDFKPLSSCPSQHSKIHSLGRQHSCMPNKLAVQGPRSDIYHDSELCVCTLYHHDI